MVNDAALPQDLSAVFTHLASCYPNEGCGVIIHGARGWRVRPMENAYDRYHARDPVGFPRTARTAYFFDPREWLAVSEETDRNGERVTCIFHSHADVGAYFSAEDAAMAAPEGEPLMPGVAYLVVAVDGGTVTDARIFRWNDGDFPGTQVAMAKDGTDL
jgi:proteasome lid subunit RPN8/RPN11